MQKRTRSPPSQHGNYFRPPRVKITISATAEPRPTVAEIPCGQRRQPPQPGNADGDKQRRARTDGDKRGQTRRREAIAPPERTETNAALRIGTPRPPITGGHLPLLRTFLCATALVSTSQHTNTSTGRCAARCAASSAAGPSLQGGRKMSE